MKYLRSIINVKDNVKSNLLRVTMNLPKMEYLLYNRLLNVIQKYEEAGKDNAVAIIKKRAYGDLDDYSSIVVLDSNC